MRVSKILQDGNIFDAAVLDLDMAYILGKFSKAVGVQTSLALGAGVPTTTSAPHSLLNGFKNLVAAAAASGYEFEQANALMSAAANAPAAAPVAAAAEAKPEPEDSKKEEEEDVDMGNLFGDDDEYA